MKTPPTIQLQNADGSWTTHPLDTANPLRALTELIMNDMPDSAAPNPSDEPFRESLDPEPEPTPQDHFIRALDDLKVGLGAPTLAQETIESFHATIAFLKAHAKQHRLHEDDLAWKWAFGSYHALEQRLNRWYRGGTL